MSELRQELAAIQLEVAALPPDKALAAVFANLFIYAQALEDTQRQLGQVLAQMRELDAKIVQLGTVKTQTLARELTELADYAWELKQIGGFIRDLSQD